MISEYKIIDRFLGYSRKGREILQQKEIFPTPIFKQQSLQTLLNDFQTVHLNC